MSDKERLDELTARSYKDQACWFLNAYWEEFGQKESEKVWAFVKKCGELDEARRHEGSDLDEFQAHRFLEHFHETLTVQAMRDRLRTSGAIVGQIKRVPLLHILIIKYNVDWRQMINAPQGSKEEVAKAQALLDQVQTALQESQERHAQAAAALREATQQEAAAKRSEADAKAREAEAKASEAAAKAKASEASERVAEAHARKEELHAAKAELEAALAELHAQEAAFNGRTAELTKLSEEGSVVQRNKAKNELAQHLSSDSLPLRRAKISQEAAVKKADRAAQAAKEAHDQASSARAAAEEAARQATQSRASAEEAARQATQARADAEESLRRSEAAKAAAEAALEEAQSKVAEAEAYLEEVKKKMPLGTAWWMDREIHEARAYLPKHKGGYNKRELGQQ
jgi:chromosome segregation ATPase